MVNTEILLSGIWKPDDLVLDINNEPRLYPAEIKRQIENFWQKEIRKNYNLFNGTVYSLTDFFSKEKKLFLSIRKTDFKTYLGTNLNPNFTDDEYLANVLGLNILVETYDNLFILGKRSEYVAEMKNMWHCIGGNLDSVNPYENAIKEVKEEINLNRKFITDTKILGLVRNAITRRNELVFYIKTNLTSDEIKKNLSKATDKAEHSKIVFLNRKKLYEMQFEKDTTPGTKGLIKLFFKIYGL